MCSVFVIICDVRAKDPLQMSLIEHDEVKKAFASDGSDHAFGVRILPCYPQGHSALSCASSRHNV